MPPMPHKRYVPAFILCTVLAACAPVTPPATHAGPTLTVAPTLTPTPTSTPTPFPTPTVTPIPAHVLTVRWPRQVSALEPVPVEVELASPPAATEPATVTVVLYDPLRQRYWESVLTPQAGGLHVARDPLQLPLGPPEGDWKLFVYVDTPLLVEGPRMLSFQPAPIALHDFTIDPAFRAAAGVDLAVPQEFTDVVVQGDLSAGGRVWRSEDGEIGLWWAPGPTEPLVFSTALVMLEATHGLDEVIEVVDVEETEWQGQTAFLFREMWPDVKDIPAEALVVQGPDHWLYVLRIRPLSERGIPSLVRQVRETFSLVPIDSESDSEGGGN